MGCCATEKRIKRIDRNLATLLARGRLVFGVSNFQEQPQLTEPTPQFQQTFHKGEVSIMVTLTSNQQVTLSVAFKDKKGNPAPVDGAPVWGVDHPNVVALEPNADGLSCVVKAVGPIGGALVSVQADADLGDGMTPLAGTSEFQVTAGSAAVVEITAGPVSEQPTV